MWQVRLGTAGLPSRCCGRAAPRPAWCKATPSSASSSRASGTSLPRGHAARGAAGRILARGLELDDWALQELFARHPGLAGLSAAKVLSNLVFLHERARIPKNTALADAVRRSPALLTADVHTQLAPTLTALRLALSAATVARVLDGCPAALLREPREISELSATFRRIGVQFDDLAATTPGVAACEAAAVRHVYGALCDPHAGPGMSASTAARVISSHPELIVGRWKPVEQIRPVVRFLRDVLGVDPSAAECGRFYATRGAVAKLGTAVDLLVRSGLPMEDVKDNLDLL